MTTTWRARAARTWESLSKQAPAPLAPPDTYPVGEVAQMLRDLGIALVEVQVPSGFVNSILTHVAARYTTEPARIVVLPTVLIVQVGSTAHEVTTSTHGTTQLDRAGKIDKIVRLASAGAITPTDAVHAVAEARTARPRFGPFTTLVGYVITTLGFGIVMNPAWTALWAYLFLGAVVGGIVVAAAKVPTLAVVVPSLSAAVVTTLAIWFVADAAGDELIRIIAPALVATLPGLSLTIGALELAGGAVMAGSSRLVYGLVQLMLLVFGVVIGISIAGKVTPHPTATQIGPVSFYVAIAVIGIGLYLYLSAPRGSLPWLTAAVAVALVGQQVGGLFLSSAHSGAVGALLVFPFAMIAARMKTAPPMYVMLLAAFWSLVPGGLGFESLSEATAGHSFNAMTLATTFSAVFSIALGTLLAWSIFDTIQARTKARIPGGVGTGGKVVL